MLNRKPTRTRFLLLVPCLLPLLAMMACSSQSGDETVNAVEIKMFEHTKVYCFGRFLVNVPREAVLRVQGNHYYANTIEIGRGDEEFKTKVASMLEKRKQETFEHGPTFVRTEYPEEDSKQIIVSREDLFGDIGYTLDVFALKNLNYYFYFTVDAFTEQQAERAVKNYRDKILPALRYRPEYEIPKEAGFCFENGFIAEAGTQGWNERASLAFTLEDRPDVWIRISSEVHFVPEESLIERYRQGDPEPRIREDGIGKREVNDVQGDEMLLSATLDGNVSYLYKWEALGEIKNPLKPGVILDIRAGERVDGIPVSSSLEKAQVRALYETIVKTIRLRPVEDPKPEPQAQAPDPEDFPHRIATGDKCPKRGHWRCVEDGHRYNFVVGQVMPNATFEEAATGFFNRLMGKRVYRDGPGHWEWAEETPPAETRG